MRFAPTIAGKNPFRRGSKAYDLLAASPLIAWYVASLFVTASALLHGTGHGLESFLNFVSQTGKFAFALILIVLLVARRTPIAQLPGLAPRIMAVLGTYLGIAMLILPGRNGNQSSLLVSSFLIFFGTTFAIYSLTWLGRSISIMPESRKLVTSGPYALIRHPLYLGEQIALFGVAMQNGSVWAFAALALQLACQLSRMSNEERVLQGSFPEYAAYRTQTARLIPWLY